MEPHPAAVLKFSADAAADLRTTFSRAIARMDDAIYELRSSAWMPEAWLGDPVSEAMRLHYNAVAVDGEYPAVRAFTDYRNELQRVVDQLDATARGYHETEAANINALHPGA